MNRTITKNMEFETALRVVDATIFKTLGRHLSTPEETILQGTWEGLTYEEMAEKSQYKLNYLMRDIGPKFWRILSQVFGEEVTKSNFRSVLARNRSAWEQEAPFIKSIKDKEHNETNVLLTADSGFKYVNFESSVFFNRDRELCISKNWLVKENCRLLLIRGASGIGKTVLAKKIAEEIQDRFELAIWKSLDRAPNLKEFLDGLLKFIARPANDYLSTTKNSDRISQLLGIFRDKPCLLILDGLEGILQPGALAGNYRNGYQDYADFFQRFAQESHQSCLIITTLENPKEITFLEGENSRVRSLLLNGLEVESAYSFFRDENLSQEDEWEKIIEKYQANPSFLKIVAKIVSHLFNGNVKEFLEQEAYIFGDIANILKQSFDRLSDIEKEILYWLAIEQQPVSFPEIQNNIPIVVSQEQLLEALSSLGQRELICTTNIDGKSLFTLDRLIVEYITKQLIDRIVSTNSYKDSSKKNLLLSEESIDLTPTTKKTVKLNQWLQYNFDSDWQSLEALLIKNKPVFATLRGTYNIKGEEFIKRCKLIKLGKSDTSQEITLLIAITPEKEDKLEIRVQIYPSQNDTLLPGNLALSLLNEEGEILRQIASGKSNNLLQLPRFRGKVKEQFSLQISLDNFETKESFII